MPIVKINWSGGKDSTCAVFMHLAAGNQVKIVSYIPMFTDEIPCICKNQYKFLFEQSHRFQAMGAEVHFCSGITYYDWVLHRATRGKNKGQIFGFPSFVPGFCGFRRDSKIKELQKCEVGEYDFEDLGIAANEYKRQKQLTPKKRSILVELGITELDALAFCKERGALSPTYAFQTRDGCALCPHAKQAERDRWLSDWPEARPILLRLQKLVAAEKDLPWPLRGYSWFIEMED